jgi:hypothetical protein
MKYVIKFKNEHNVTTYFRPVRNSPVDTTDINYAHVFDSIAAAENVIHRWKIYISDGNKDDSLWKTAEVKKVKLVEDN